MQEIIIYRNPLDAMIWHSMMNGGVGVFFTVIALGIFWVIAHQITEKLLKKRYGWEANKKAIWGANIATLSLGAYLNFQYIG